MGTEESQIAISRQSSALSDGEGLQGICFYCDSPASAHHPLYF